VSKLHKVGLISERIVRDDYYLFELLTIYLSVQFPVVERYRNYENWLWVPATQKSSVL